MPGRAVITLLRHHVAHLLVEAPLEAQIAIGQNSDQTSVRNDRQPGDPETLHHRDRFADFLLGADGDRIDDHPGFIFLDGLDFGRLFLDRKIAMHKADAAHLRDCDRRARFGDGVHRTRYKRNSQADLRA